MVKKMSERGNDSEFRNILLDLRDKCRKLTQLNEALDCILSFDGRFPIELGRKSLTRLQQAIAEVMGSKTGLVFSDDPVAPIGITFGVTEYGRIILSRDSMIEIGDLGFGHVPVTEAEWEKIIAVKSRTDDEAERARMEVGKFFQSLDGDSILKMLGVVEKMVDHVDPVMIYVEDRTYTLYGKRNNLLDRMVRRRTIPGNLMVGKSLMETRGSSSDFLFSYLREREVACWNDDEKMFIYCMYWLKQSGGRGEEFNGLQLSYQRLHEHFDSTINRMKRAGLSSATLPANATIYEKAACLNKWRQEIKRTHIIYRVINGLNFYKIDDFLPRKAVGFDSAGDVPNSLKEYFAEVYRMPLDQYASLDDLARELMPRIFAGDVRHKRPGKFPTPIEELLDVIVKSAVEESFSDIGMTRCIRRIEKIKRINDPNNCLEACNWPVSDYYCCVVPSDRWVASMASRREELTLVLYAIAKRMEYNSWHYLPGYYEPGRIPDGRHFFIPPAMPDLTEWSNTHHGGHIIANVLYSIRSPGSLNHGGREFNGMFDLRLMRQQGEPYTLVDLKRAIVFTGYLKAFYQALLDFVCAHNIEFHVTAFTKPWYDFHFNGKG